MTRRDKDKTSFVDFMRSIKFRQRDDAKSRARKRASQMPRHFAHLNSRVRRENNGHNGSEDASPVRSGN